MNAAKWLVIGIGNDLRGDDGVGKAVCDQLRAEGCTDFETMAVRQAMPELAEPISRAAGVIFVDAELMPLGSTSIRLIIPAPQTPGTSHVLSPESVVMLAKSVFGRCPPAWLLSIPIDDVAFHVGLSPRARAGVDQAVAIILGVLATGAVTSATRGGAGRPSC